MGGVLYHYSVEVMGKPETKKTSQSLQALLPDIKDMLAQGPLISITKQEIIQMTEAALICAGRKIELSPKVLARMAKAAILYYDGLDTSKPELRLIDDDDLRAIELASLLKNL
jgi:hypothetical protein